MLTNNENPTSATVLQFPRDRCRAPLQPALGIPDDIAMIAALNNWRGGFSSFSLAALRDRRKKPRRGEWLGWPHLLTGHSYYRDTNGVPACAVGYWDAPLESTIALASDWATTTGLTVWLDRAPNLRAAILRRGDAITWPTVTAA